MSPHVHLMSNSDNVEEPRTSMTHEPSLHDPGRESAQLTIDASEESVTTLPPKTLKQQTFILTESGLPQSSEESKNRGQGGAFLRRPPTMVTAANASVVPSIAPVALFQPDVDFTNTTVTASARSAATAPGLDNNIARQRAGAFSRASRCCSQSASSARTSMAVIELRDDFGDVSISNLSHASLRLLSSVSEYVAATMRFCEVQDSLSSSDEFTLTTGGCRSEVAALVINQFRDLRDVDSNLVEKLGLSTPCLLPVVGLQERVLDDHEGLSLEPLSDNADISQQLITNNSNIQATAQAAMAGLVVQHDQVSSLLMLSGIWCMPLLRDRVLHILHTGDHFCGSFTRPLAAPLTPSTSSSKVADNNYSPAPSRNVQLLLVQVPQVYVLLGQALACGLDNADGSISGLRENCMSWMWKWRGRLLGHKGTAEVLGRASYAEVCEAIGAISRTELTPVGTLVALEEWKKLSTVLPQTNIGTHWSAPAAPLLSRVFLIASVATAVMAAAMGMLWRSFTTVASSTKFSSFLSSPWSEDIMTGLLDHARENMGVEVCINNLLGWPSTPFGSSCEDYPWGMGQDGIKESVQQLKQLLDSYIVRHGTAILRSEFFKSLPENQKDRIVAMAQGQMRSGVSQPGAAAGLSFLVPSSQVSKPSRATSAKTPSDSSLTVVRATIQRTSPLSSRTTTSASSVKSAAGSAAHASQLRSSLNNKNAVSSTHSHDRNRATPLPGKEAPSVDAAKLKTSVVFTQDNRMQPLRLIQLSPGAQHCTEI
ncbi:hypothetical protein CEUSTIGMA_g1520.t1 [Chlamydomonas eustigma]|uniref:Uncharacterized protein n=1 Tax=Chlamydomonas eustigma TaxID=1157962 RepID=A0A250WU36_9CHLO|nr:hypothetical protein CEUSTIGMA_g1520.t1 [Chlamydomonas eustigma]|eukprot:GAX74070.1 hypothetical protein CEUSTIGMA_g1520.t1 [Chlamydomonas eustigma]